MSDHFIDAKVRNGTVNRVLVITCLLRKHSHVVSIRSLILQGGSSIIINGTGPVSSKKWLLFNREIRNPADSDVSDVALFLLTQLFCPNRFFFLNLNLILSSSSDRNQSQLVRSWQNCSEIRGASRLSALAAFTTRDHLWTSSLRELSHQWGQPRDRWLWTLLQRRKQRRDEQPVEQPKL